MLRVVFLYIVPFALAVYALADLVKYREDSPLGLPKGIWAIIVIVMLYIGPIGWIAISRTSQPRPGRAQAAPRSGPLAPDDDPDFLWQLGQQQRREREAQEKKKKKRGEKPGSDDPTAK